MKRYKLIFHQRTQPCKYPGEVALCSKDFSRLKENDFVEISFPDESCFPFVLQLTKGSLREDFPNKDSISLDQTIATTFQLKAFTEVVVCKVEAFMIALDSLELTFKDQYLGRSEMWRLRNSLDKACVYIGKKIEFCGTSIRCQIHELWSGGVKVASGLVTEATKIVFRSQSSMVYLFIQMSSEMWEFDIYGDLYFEKAVNGFLSELFEKWKQNGSSHEVTVVLFSRLYYYASAMDQFPDTMRECLLSDYKGRFYEDFYRVVIQNEKYEDWRNTLISLHEVFVDYHDYLLNFHKNKHPEVKIPKCYISTAAQGNFLEVLNMSLNVFEKHFVDRSFDRTGQLSIVITPGVGVFEVDRDLTNVTMQRVIDNGVGSDLVCVGEQPLHAVPLLKFHNKATAHHEVDDYSMPHWINLSFYSTDKKVGYATFVPRIKLPMRTISFRDNFSSQSSQWDNNWNTYSISAVRLGDEIAWPNSVYDFDSYDDSTFKPSSGQLSTKRRMKQIKRPRTLTDTDFNKIFLRQNSEPEIRALTSTELNSSNSSLLTMASNITFPPSQSSSAITIPSKVRVKKSENVYSSSFGALNIECAQPYFALKPRVALTPINDRWLTDDVITNRPEPPSSPSMSSQGGSPKENDSKTRFTDMRRPSRSLINPFDPSHAVIKLTSNRRRWTHIFPRGPTGTLIQQHHFSSGLAKLDIVPEGESTVATYPDTPGKLSHSRLSKDSSDSSVGGKKVTRLWGATGEQEWTPTLTTGVDWKSMIIPACLPLTTDYFPDERSLQTDYLVSDYSLLPDDVNADYSSQRVVYRRPLTTKEVFYELVSQRLAQGFQSVIRPKLDITPVKLNTSLMRSNTSVDEDSLEEYFLSIGRIFHRISLCSSTITVTRYRPRHPYPAIQVNYKYRFYAPNNNNFEISYADFTTEKLETYNWNFLDHYICTRGDKDFTLTENLKYWRLRMFVLPLHQAPVYKKIMDEKNSYCDLYESVKLEEKRVTIREFMKFIETCINRIRRPNNSFPKGPRGPSGGSIGSTNSGGFRERVNSNQLNERPRIRSGPKLMEKQRQESGSGRISPFDSNFQGDSKGNFTGIQEPLTDLMQNQMHINPRTEGSGETVPVIYLKADANYQDIVSSMRSQTTGFSFIKSSDLPPWTFVSYDAVTWLINHMEGITSDSKAIHILNGMLTDRYISHASGDSKHPFLNGFYLYYIITNDIGGLSMEPLVPVHSDSSMFHNEWMEVDVPCEDELEAMKENILPNGFSDIRSTFKEVYVDVDVSKKSDRQEWGHVRYQSLYTPDEAYEITVQWIQATGAVITDLVGSWSRKAQPNLQVIPVPTDPFALPSSSNSDPLRGPISIKFALNDLSEIDSTTINEIAEDALLSKIVYFQHAIALKFGFVICSRHAPAQQYTVSIQPTDDALHYVHSSGNMFLIVQICPIISQINFLWSWNYLVSKRWRTTATPTLGDDPFMFKILHDFKSFCVNDNNRLQKFWDTTFSIENSDEVNKPEPANNLDA